MGRALRVAEVRAEELLIELLRSQGWDTRKPPNGEVLRQHEYKDHDHLAEILRGISKSGKGDGKPEAFLVDRETVQPLAVIEVKSDIDDLEKAVKEATTVYGRACIDAGYTPLAIALAGATEDKFQVRVLKWMGTRWLPITYDGHPIGWIPNRADTERLLTPGAPREIRPSVPPPEVLAERADEINRLLRESGIKDEFRPAVVGAIMLALWQSKGNIRKDPNHILSDINEACSKAFWKAKKQDLAKSIRVDEANDDLARNARRIVSILERLNVTVLTAEHDYLGYLYEAFFRYTGGNTIGQYFTPRHIAEFMAALMDVESTDTVLDPTCGTGGFLIAVMNHISKNEHLSKAQMVKLIPKRLIGFDKEPVTAALCVANMILRGDGSTSVHRGDAFTSDEYPVGDASVVLTNPPFPHAKTDTPPERFISRALDGLQQRGRMAIVVPRSLLGKPNKRKWQASVLTRNTLDAVIVLPDELFEPYASSYTAVLVMTKGVKHPADHPVFFARIENDGFRRYKNVRMHCEGEQLSLALRAFHKREIIPGFCGWTTIKPSAGWDAGYYIPARPLSEEEISAQSAALTRHGAAFVVAHAPELTALNAAVSRGDLVPRNYREMKGRPEGMFRGSTIGGHFDIFYGQKALHNKDGLSPGPALIISSSGTDNGSYGFFDFDAVIEPPFVTVPSTGSIGRAHVQKWPCGVTDDCLILVPKRDVPQELLYVAAAVVRQERWRFNYGRKITPDRIAGYPLPVSEEVLDRVREHVEIGKRIELLALEMAEDDEDEEIARLRIAELRQSPERLVQGDNLRERLDKIENE
jgi:type I restriction enzyme M protein